jgi:hypothetical protein
MKRGLYLLGVMLVLIYSCNRSSLNKNSPIALHPENYNYFIYNGKPTILVTSGEHYGAVMNGQFDFGKYLQTLSSEGLNYTRIFSGPYAEQGGAAFGIENNTMNPAPGHWLTPWAQDSTSGKYDLNNWNPVYFDRLHHFFRKAEEQGIIVELSLFTSFYSDNQWNISPFHPRNNDLAGIDSMIFRKLNTMENGNIMAVQETYVRKMVRELNPYPNLIFEIQNEPWSDNPEFKETIPVDTLVRSHSWQRRVETAMASSLEWQKKIAGFITSEEAGLPNKHLIAQNISNFRHKVADINPDVSIINFHYAYPEAAYWNLPLKRALVLDETGFMPHQDIYYLSEAWKFILGGGATYNNLDYSFTVGFEDGTYKIAERTPGWGGTGYRKQLRFMKDFIESFDFLKMKPANHLLTVVSGSLPGYAVFAEEGKQYAIYLERKNNVELELQLPVGDYTYTDYDPVEGRGSQPLPARSIHGKLKIDLPASTGDIVVKIMAK